MIEITHIFAAIVYSACMFFIGRLSKTDKKVLEAIHGKPFCAYRKALNFFISSSLFIKFSS